MRKRIETPERNKYIFNENGSMSIISGNQEKQINDFNKKYKSRKSINFIISSIT